MDSSEKTLLHLNDLNCLIFATNNQHKVNEVRLVLPPALHILSLKEAGIDSDVEEPFDTLEANAEIKATTISQLTGKDCFSEDTGLEVLALGGEPGVKSARYAGESRSSLKNMEKLLHRLAGREDKSARFRTVICLSLRGRLHFFEGICHGVITSLQKGAAGFGYDPIFIPDGSNQTFAQMSIEEKNKFSHRRKAFDKLIAFLNNTDLNEQI